MDAETVAADAEADPENVARLICLKLLAEAPRTRRHLADALSARHVPDAAAGAVLDRLTDVGLIDDAAFATSWVISRQQGRGISRRALRAELRQRGVDAEVVETALIAVDRDDELAAARALVARRLSATVELARPARVRRLAGMLARRGYSADLIQQVVREALGESLSSAE